MKEKKLLADVLCDYQNSLNLQNCLRDSLHKWSLKINTKIKLSPHTCLHILWTKNLSYFKYDWCYGLNYVLHHPEKYVEVLTPSISECDIIRGIARAIS